MAQLPSLALWTPSDHVIEYMRALLLGACFLSIGFPMYPAKSMSARRSIISALPPNGVADTTLRPVRRKESSTGLSSGEPCAGSRAMSCGSVDPKPNYILPGIAVMCYDIAGCACNSWTSARLSTVL